jgi:hypothetical protein
MEYKQNIVYFCQANVDSTKRCQHTDELKLHLPGQRWRWKDFLVGSKPLSRAQTTLGFVNHRHARNVAEPQPTATLLVKSRIKLHTKILNEKKHENVNESCYHIDA